MTKITTRAAAGRPLTYAEMDANFSNLNSGKAEQGAVDTLSQKVTQVGNTASTAMQSVALIESQSGAQNVGYGSDTVGAVLDSLQLASYAALRAYVGPRQSVYVTGYLATVSPSGIAGIFIRDDNDSTSADNSGTVIVSSNGKRWKRAFSGPVSFTWFGASGNGVTDDTSAIQATFTACAAAGLLPVFVAGSFKITSTIDAKGLSLVGSGRSSTQLICNVANGVPTFSNVGQVVRDLHWKGPGNGAKPDGFTSSGYKRYIQNCYFDTMGDCYCPTDIIVTTVIDGCEFFSCQSNINDKLLDGTNSHTTLYFTNCNTLYGVAAFVLKTQVGGWLIQGAVFEDMLYVFNASNNIQIASSTFNTVWIEQVYQNCTIFNGIYSGSTNNFQNVQARPGQKSISDANRVISSQFSGTGGGAGGGGGTAIDSNGIRICDFAGTGVLVTKDGILPSAAQANYASVSDFTIWTQAANATQAGRGGDLVFSPGGGSYGQRAGVIRPNADLAVAFGDSAYRWKNIYSQQLTLAPPASAAPVNNGDMVFQKTSDTQLTIKVKGSDGVIRSANFTLA